MPVSRVSAQLFDALVAHGDGRRGRLCLARQRSRRTTERDLGRPPVLLILIGALAGLVPFAHANVPDPLWIGGIYDAADCDDFAAAVSSGEAEPASSPPAGALLILVGVVLPAGALSLAPAPLLVFPIRAPPLCG